MPDLASFSESELSQVKRDVENIASGSEESNVSPQFVAGRLEELKDLAEESEEEAIEKGGPGRNKEAYAKSVYRSALYGSRGRIFLKVLGLQNKVYAAAGRAEITGELQYQISK